MEKHRTLNELESLIYYDHEWFLTQIVLKRLLLYFQTKWHSCKLEIIRQNWKCPYPYRWNKCYLKLFFFGSKITKRCVFNILGLVRNYFDFLLIWFYRIHSNFSKSKCRLLCSRYPLLWYLIVYSLIVFDHMTIYDGSDGNAFTIPTLKPQFCSLKYCICLASIHMCHNLHINTMHS